ncbi:hypothetical protein DACRYDRAFT_114092 [Dacryopinax primogenitus]|uniref:Uncharacterized protein n=1 Tax=Dacryopinax primogenitus (strain DJM 731) TaxID=1858805 RepID=M5G3G5_DACPD|nr:uncharacterized protein DACRYDRAFT_114092 [Dacryopinax primogenitus]EJU04761.1 hypothetical protein DACRYDRAFT_114092 [Dacryopinax primogenitus]
MSEGRPSQFSQPSTTSTNLTVDYNFEVVDDSEPETISVIPQKGSSLLGSVSPLPLLPHPPRSPLREDEDWIGNQDVYGSDDDFGDVAGGADDPDYDLLPLADTIRHPVRTNGPSREVFILGPPPIPVDVNDGRRRPTLSPPATVHPPRTVRSGLPTPSSDSEGSIHLVFPSAPDYHPPSHENEDAAPALPSHLTDAARSDISELSNDADNERSTVASIASITPSMFSVTSTLSDIGNLPPPSPDALHVILVGHKAADPLKEEILDAVFALYPGQVTARDSSTEASDEASSSTSHTIQFYDYHPPDMGSETMVEEVRVYDLTLRHAVTSYYNITGKMVTPPVPVLTVFFIDPALCKGRVPGFFPSAMIGKSIAVVLPRSDASSPQNLSPMGSEHSDLPKESDYINISRGVDPADLMSAQHVWSNLQASYLFDGIEIRHTVDFDRQVISVDELWAASARHEARSAALKLINPELVASVVRTSSGEESSPGADVSSPSELSASTSTIGGSVHTARGSVHAVQPATDSRLLVNPEPVSQAELSSEFNEKEVTPSHSIYEDARSLVGSLYTSKYAAFLPDLQKTYLRLRRLVHQNPRTLVSVAIAVLAVSVLYLRRGPDGMVQPPQLSLVPLTPPPTFVRPPETSADAAVFTQKVQGMDIPRATPLLTIDTKKKPLGLSTSPQPFSISGVADLKTIDTSLLSLPLNTDLVTVESMQCNTCFQLVGSSRTKSDTIFLGGTTATPNVRVASETGATAVFSSHTDAAIETDESTATITVREVQEAVNTYVHEHNGRARKNVRVFNAMGSRVAKKALGSIVSTLNEDSLHDSTAPEEKLSWYDEFMEPFRQALAARKARTEAMLAEEDSTASKRRPSGEIIQEFLFHGAHAIIG